MFRRREAVPFAFVAEADRFRSNVTVPPQPRASTPQLLGRTLIGLTMAAAFAGSLLFGMPALDSGQGTGSAQQSEASQGR
ncbi:MULTISPECIES: hypothetical protein [unclassified Streptomyces]|uniref:hypothetical protein n=1 Tax=unclassified Streptomyces TaxID=2593676 RepID=UPI0038053394